MREPHRHRHIFAAGRGDQRTTPTPLGPLSPEIETTRTETQLTAAQLEKGRLITPPDASDVRNQKNPPKTAVDKPTLCRNHLHPHSREPKPYALHKQRIPSTALTTNHTANESYSKSEKHPLQIATPAPQGGGPPRSPKRRDANAQTHSSYSHTIAGLADLMNTCTDVQYTQIIQQLPAE